MYNAAHAKRDFTPITVEHTHNGAFKSREMAQEAVSHQLSALSGAEFSETGAAGNGLLAVEM
jgi:hypothetical protein